MFDTPIILFNHLCAGIPSNTHSPHLLFPCPKPRIQPRTLLIPTLNTISKMAYTVTEITLIPLFLKKNGDFGQPRLQGPLCTMRDVAALSLQSRFKSMESSVGSKVAVMMVSHIKISVFLRQIAETISRFEMIW